MLPIKLTIQIGHQATNNNKNHPSKLQLNKLLSQSSVAASKAI